MTTPVLDAAPDIAARLPRRLSIRPDHRRRNHGMPTGVVWVGNYTKWATPYRWRTSDGLARTPGVDDPEAEWEYEGRISKAGNRHDYHHPSGRITVCHIRYMTRRECVDLYRSALLGTPTPAQRMSGTRGLTYWIDEAVTDPQSGQQSSRRVFHRVTVEMARAELAGKDLACSCPAGQPCHADILLAAANGQEISNA